MESIKYPCKDCKERHIGCHGNCEKYLAAKNARDDANHKKFVEHCTFVFPHRPTRTNHSLKTHKQRVEQVTI